MRNEAAAVILEEFLDAAPNFREEFPNRPEEEYEQMDAVAEALRRAISVLSNNCTSNGSQ